MYVHSSICHPIMLDGICLVRIIATDNKRGSCSKFATLYTLPNAGTHARDCADLRGARGVKGDEGNRGSTITYVSINTN